MRLSSAVPTFCTTTSELQSQSLHKLATCEHTQSPTSLHCQGWTTLPSSPWGNALQTLCYQPPPQAAPSAPARHSACYASLLNTSTPWSQSPAGNGEKGLSRLNLVKPAARKQIKKPQTDRRTSIQSHGMCKMGLPHNGLGHILPKCIKKGSAVLSFSQDLFEIR